MEHLNVMIQPQLHFINEMFEQIKEDSNNVVAVIPTLTFLLFTFLLTHTKIHRRSGPLTSLKVYLYREILFQWTFFYLTRAWFLIIALNKSILKWSDKLKEDKFYCFNGQHIQSLSFMILTCLGMVPFYTYLIHCLWKQQIPNFLMWIGDDPWERSEIGLSGHYLERPPTFRTQKRKEYAYRSKRSISVEGKVNADNMKPLRNCKSLTFTINPMSFANNIIY